MKKLLTLLERVFHGIENSPLSLGMWALAFTCLITIRLTIDLTVEGVPSLTFFQIFFQWSHLLLFFLFSYLLLLPLVQVAGKTTLPKAARVLLFGFLLILFAPILDKLIFGDSLYWSFYIFDSLPHMGERFFTFFGDKPHLGITYGTRISVALILFSMFLYGWVKTRALARTAFFTFCIYGVLFFLGTLPSWLAYLMAAPQTPVLSVTDTDIAEIFLSPETILGRVVPDLRSALAYKMSLILLLLIALLTLGYWYTLRKKEFWAFLKNARWPQIFCQNGILFLGVLLAFIYTDAVFPTGLFSFLALLTLVLAVTSAWIASVLWNDIYDQKVDTISNANRPLIAGIMTPAECHIYAVFFFCVSIFGAGLVSFPAALFLISYQALGMVYSAPPFRLKRFLGLATLVVSVAALLILFIGYSIFNPDHTLSALPLSLVLYLGAVYIVMLPLKDFKDVAGDKKDHIYTLPVVLGRERAKIVMSSVSFLVFMSSIFILHAPQLLLWAFLFASISFWIIQKAKDVGGRILYRNLMALFFALAFLYGIGITLFLF